MQVVAWMARKLAPDERRFVRGVVIQDQIHIQLGRHRSIDAVEKFAELEGAMARMTLANHGARLDIERGEQRGRAMPHVVVRGSGCPGRIGSSGAVRSSAWI